MHQAYFTLILTWASAWPFIEGNDWTCFLRPSSERHLERVDSFIQVSEENIDVVVLLLNEEYVVGFVFDGGY